MASISGLSDLLGYTSIACWLGAQFPQLLENLRRQSCDSLALPFLANWLLGDFSNLVGCILTHQLPFQTWLAAYFVSIDCMLISQYIYYSCNSKFAHSRTVSSGASGPRISIERGASRYRTVSAVAANVAAAAALVAQQDEEAGHRHRRQRQSVDQLHDHSERHTFVGSAADVGTDDDSFAALADSFHSERGHESKQKRVSWSIERHRRRGGSADPLLGNPTALQFTSTDSLSGDLDPLGRGRALQRDTSLELERDAISANRRNSRASRRGATMVFLSVFALFSVGAFAGSKGDLSTYTRANVGRVLGLSLPPDSSFLMESAQPAPPINLMDPELIGGTDPSNRFLDVPVPAKPSNERVIGRVFAWLCTTLYLTSRLPQIWKNFARKSVEGLSMYLFISAFLGNTFYVASILSSPKMRLPVPASTEFIKESIPYLLGSGGTLMFDITIVGQSFIYRPRVRRQSSVHRLDEEETGLLAGEHPQHAAGDSTAQPRGRTSQTRTNV